ncbi:hypothetical protein CCR75_007662 [Bremia lactucae]|uniref:Uncharacterized protein n=1 Tax=Bremia lactucae TaxID=4779 RepID=A0A976IE61_BRELC|nr:hypothetical protein CCR75_007662 [Bremia lactucae]
MEDSLKTTVAAILKQVDFANPHKTLPFKDYFLTQYRADPKFRHQSLNQLYEVLKMKLGPNYLLMAGLHFFNSDKNFSKQFGKFLSHFWTEENYENLKLSFVHLNNMLAKDDGSFATHPLKPIVEKIFESSAKKELDTFELNYVFKPSTERTSDEKQTDAILKSLRNSKYFRNAFLNAKLHQRAVETPSTDPMLRMWVAVVWAHSRKKTLNDKSFSKFFTGVTGLTDKVLNEKKLFSKHEFSEDKYKIYLEEDIFTLAEKDEETIPKYFMERWAMTG